MGSQQIICILKYKTLFYHATHTFKWQFWAEVELAMLQCSPNTVSTQYSITLTLCLCLHLAQSDIPVVNYLYEQSEGAGCNGDTLKGHI